MFSSPPDDWWVNSRCYKGLDTSMNLEVFLFSIAMSNFVRKYFKGNKTHFITSKISDWTQLAIKRMPSFKTKMFYLQSLMDYQLIQWRHPNIQNDHKSSGQVHSFWGNIFIVKYLPQVSLVERPLVVTIIVYSDSWDCHRLSCQTRGK